MTSKQRAYLKKLASALTPVVQVGKNGATPEVVTSINEAIEKRELIKINVQENCLEDIKETANTLAERSRSQLVQVIGRKIVLYKENKEEPTIVLPK
ncbi:MAG: ribosome assembly RNA-binding protein YhbY [Firmicutes bacterium]|nr:ribosome assembly RNA-binding protein YhbY [Bacillota bacterium]